MLTARRTSIGYMAQLVKKPDANVAAKALPARKGGRVSRPRPGTATPAGTVPAAARPLHIYLIVNNKLNGEFKLVKPRTVPIASKAISLNMRRSLASTVDLSYLYAKAHGIDFNLSFIDKAYPANEKNLFDTAFMRALFDYGRKLGETGTFWSKRPPDQDE